MVRPVAAGIVAALCITSCGFVSDETQGDVARVSRSESTSSAVGTPRRDDDAGGSGSRSAGPETRAPAPETTAPAQGLSPFDPQAQPSTAERLLAPVPSSDNPAAPDRSTELERLLGQWVVRSSPTPILPELIGPGFCSALLTVQRSGARLNDGVNGGVASTAEILGEADQAVGGIAEMVRIADGALSVPALQRYYQWRSVVGDSMDRQALLAGLSPIAVDLYRVVAPLIAADQCAVYQLPREFWPTN